MTDKASIRMLQIDDKTVTSDLDRAGYRNMGVLVRTAASFAEAEKSVRDGKVDIIVINADYRGIDGYQVTKHFKAALSTREIPVVVTSVQTSAKVKKAAIDAGADLFVEQPLPRQYFIEKVKKLLEKTTRNHERVSIHGDLEYEVDGVSHRCPIGDLSTSGVLLATEATIAIGTVVNLSFSIPGYKKPIQVAGEVVRIIKPTDNPNRDFGIGIRFAEFLGDSQKRLEKYIEKEAIKDDRMIYYL
jgi:CheY-like chemotaxis protein/Tfp pilus assembly protein PilZ